MIHVTSRHGTLLMIFRSLDTIAVSGLSLTTRVLTLFATFSSRKENELPLSSSISTSCPNSVLLTFRILLAEIPSMTCMVFWLHFLPQLFLPLLSILLGSGRSLQPRRTDNRGINSWWRKSNWNSVHISHIGYLNRQYLKNQKDAVRTWCTTIAW